MASGRVRFATCRVRLDRVIGPLEWCNKGPIHDQQNSQYFVTKKGRPIFDKIFDSILPTHVPSKFWSKFIVLKMFDPDAAVTVALVLAKCSPENWIFLFKILTGAHTRVKILKSCQNIDDWSKYIKQIWSVNILSRCIFWQKISHTRSKIQSKFWCQFFASLCWRIFWSCMGPFKAGNTHGVFVTFVSYADEVAKLTECTHTAYLLTIVFFFFLLFFFYFIGIKIRYLLF